MRPRMLIALCLVLLMIIPSAVSMARPYHDRELDMEIDARGTVLNGYLSKQLKDLRPEDKLGVIVQFKKEIRDKDLIFMDAIGMTVKRKFRVIPAVFAIGFKDSVVQLSGYKRTHWMEYNQQMDLLMQETTTIINATKVWNTRPLDVVGKMGEPVDGTGVTVALVDTGIDAGHPDLDYGEKVIINLKSDFDGTFTEVEDSDTGSGHGTHVAGTIGGNGDASAGARRGVAPGAKIIGISTGEHWLQNVLGALEWVYEHSRPTNNPYNIRVVSNSWGSGAGEYDPNNAITVIANKITYENDVVVVFAAGNSGEDDHDGHTIETSIYGNTPSIIEVAASLHEGDGLAYFSSRGEADLNQTWPDITAPGYHIWSTEARKTQITAMVNALNTGDDLPDAYYMSISGTSMATPHVSGAVALLWQAAPSLRVMNLSDDSMSTEPDYWNSSETRIHEAEWILEATATYIEPTGDNGIPDNYSMSSNHFYNRYDYGQGYGLINMDKAVQLALVLEEKRRTDPDYSVYQAYRIVYNNTQYPDGIGQTMNVTEETNTLFTEWRGEWGYLNDERNGMVTAHARQVYIPNGTQTLTIDLNYNPATSERWAIGELTVVVDSDGDGNTDWTGQGGYNSHGWKHDEVSVSTIGSTDSTWNFLIIGEYMKAPGRERPNYLNNQFNEVLVEYTIGIKALLDTSADNTTYIPEPDLHAAVSKWKFGDPEGDFNGTITMPVYVYNYSRIVEGTPPAPPSHVEPGFPWWLVGVVFVIGALGVAYYLAKKRGMRFGLPGSIKEPRKAKGKPIHK